MKGQMCASCLLTVTVVCSVFLNFVESRNLPLVDSSAKCRNTFGYKYYYDHGTEHCEPCREICEYAKIMRTEEQCQEECPKFLTAQRCKKEKSRYYDEVTDTCSPCTELCDHHVATGNTRACRKHCSDYLEKLTPKQVPSHHKLNHLKAVDGSDTQEDSKTSDLLVHPGWIASMAVGGVALVCLVVVVIVLYWTCAQQRQQYGPAPQQDDSRVEEERRNRAHRPVEETSQGSSSLMHFAIDGAASGLPPTVAFADLRDDGTRGTRV